jgi:hypothetical protein
MVPNSWEEVFFELVAGRLPLEPWLPRARPLMAELGRYREWSASRTAQKEDLWQWYALSRANEVLIGGLAGALPHASAHLRQDLQRRDALFQYESLVGGTVPRLSAEEYRGFFEALGFSLFGGGDFSPFRHEIVEVVDDGSSSITVERTFWPGLTFGELLFSRAGVRVRSGALKKPLAERSPLYFTWWRPHRDTEDLSHGWGSNSQWRTEFRRDYQSGGKLHYNVDGKWPVEAEVVQRADSDLSVEERIELLTHRCFVRCDKRPWGRWPFGDRYVV